MLFSILFYTFLSFPKPPIYFTAFTDNKIIKDLNKTLIKTSLLVDEDCSNCTDLIKKLNRNCVSLAAPFAIFATGTKKGLNKKLQPLLNKKIPVWYNTNIQTFLTLKISILPTYISKTGKTYPGVDSSFKALLQDNICKK